MIPVREMTLGVLLFLTIFFLLALWGAFGFWGMFWIAAGCWAVAVGIIAGIILGLRWILRKLGYL